MKEQFKKVNSAKTFSLILRVVTAICVCAVLLQAQTDRIAVRKNDQTAQNIANATLKALGGADKIDAVKSLIVKGTRTSTTTGSPVRDDGTRISEFEIRVLWPDDYIMITRSPDRIGASGVSQGKILSNTSNATLSDIRRELMLMRESLATGHMLIGALMKSGVRQMTLSSMGSGVFYLNMDAGIFNGFDTFDSEIQFDSKTGYPSVIKYNEPSDLAGGIMEYRFGSDRFSVDGIMFPRVINSHRVTIIDGMISTSEMRIEEVIINPKLSLKDFERPE